MSHKSRAWLWPLGVLIGFLGVWIIFLSKFPFKIPIGVVVILVGFFVSQLIWILKDKKEG